MMNMLNRALAAALAVYALAASASATSSFSERTSSLARSTLGMTQDTAITAYIYAKLASRPNLANSSIDISTTAGKVIVNGIVNNEDQAQEVQKLAENTAGVRSADASKLIVAQQDNGLYLKSSTPLPTAATHPLPVSKEAPQQPLISEEPVPVAEPAVESPESKLSALDPLATKPPLNEPPAHREKHALPRLKHLSHQHLKHHKKKTRLAKHKKPTSFAHKKPVAHLQKTGGAAKPHHLQRQQRLATRKPSPPKVFSQKNNPESVGQMTNSFLKSTLTADQPIPEE